MWRASISDRFARKLVVADCSDHEGERVTRAGEVGDSRQSYAQSISSSRRCVARTKASSSHMPSSLATHPSMLSSGTTPSFSIQRTKRERPGLASGESGQDRTCECRLAAKGEMEEVTKERSCGI